MPGNTVLPVFSIFLCLLLASRTDCYFEHSSVHDTTPDYVPRVAVPRPWQLLPFDDFTFSAIGEGGNGDIHDDGNNNTARAEDAEASSFHASMITAIAPSTTLAANGSVLEIQYSVHYHAHFVRTRQGKGVFDRRGVFASDPPIATCTPCGNQGGISGSNATGGTVTQSTASCILHTYLGVFRSHVGPVPAASSSYCYDSSYSGVFQASSSTSTGLPCCFTIPASCRSNASASTSYTYTTGVFRSTTFMSNFTTTNTSSTANPSSLRSLSTVSATSSKSSSSKSSSNNSRTSSSVAGTVNVGLSTVAPNQATSSSLSSSTKSSVSGTAQQLNGITSVTVISSSTITVTVSLSSPLTKTSSKSGSTILAPVTLSVVTAYPSLHSPYVSTVVTTVNNTIYGCGTASGSGEVIGTGTVYVAGGVGIISSGTISGSATKVVGCGTLIATSGSFSGSATIIGCGTGSGSATLDGSGTVYPAALGGLVGITSSGRVTGSGLVIGCGTIIGSGTFTANGPYTTTRFETVAPNQGTVEVYVSYCPSDENGLPRLAGNRTSPAIVSYFPVGSDSTPNIDETLDNPLCHICDNDAGICCPLSSPCTSNGHCPWQAMLGSGYVLGGLNVVAAKNSSSSDSN